MADYSPKCNVNKSLKPYLLPSNTNCRHKLDIIENLFPVHETVRDLNIGNVNIYPREMQYEQLRNAIAEYVGTNSDNIIITAGSDNALKLIVDTFVGRDTYTLIATPTYPHMKHFLELSGCKITTCGHDNLRRHDHTCDLIYVVSPNIAYGNITTLETIEHLCKNINTLCIIDEAYIEFSDAKSAVSLVDKYPNLIVVRTFSKAFAIAGLRLGYLITSKTNIDLLTISHNPKTVTQIAMQAGQCSLQNLSYYRDIWHQFEDEKVYLRTELDKIISDHSPIIGYNISHGNFYLLRCQDTALVTKLFSRCGIDVRDKHADCPNYIRVSIGTRSINQDVIKVCRRINLKNIIQVCGDVIIDLDNTLRDGAKLTDNLLIDDSLISQLQSLISHSHIVTNNPMPPHLIADYFAKKHLLIHHDRIHTSLSALKNYLKQHYNNDVMLICDDETRKYLTNDTNANDTNYSAVAIINNFYSLNLSNIIKISEIVHSGGPIIITDSSPSCTRKNCADDIQLYDASYDGNLLIPDLASVCKIFESIGAKIICVGKPSLFCISDIINNSKLGSQIQFVIGDSGSDHELAKALGCEFVHVNTNANTLYNWEKDHHCISNISEIL